VGTMQRSSKQGTTTRSNKWGVAMLGNSNTDWNKPKVTKKKKQLTNYKLILQTLQNKGGKKRLGGKKCKTTKKIKKTFNPKQKVLKV